MEREACANLCLCSHESVTVGEGCEHALAKVVGEEGGWVCDGVYLAGREVEEVKRQLGVVELLDAGQKGHVEASELEAGLREREGAECYGDGKRGVVAFEIV